MRDEGKLLLLLQLVVKNGKCSKRYRGALGQGSHCPLLQEGKADKAVNGSSLRLDYDWRQRGNEDDVCPSETPAVVHRHGDLAEEKQTDASGGSNAVVLWARFRSRVRFMRD